jgi:hypothetical protein
MSVMNLFFNLEIYNDISLIKAENISFFDFSRSLLMF